MDFAEISIHDKVLFDNYLKSHNPQASELTFTNMFMWRNYYKFRYTVVADLLCVISAADNTTPYAFTPIGELTDEKVREAVLKLKEYFIKKDWKLEFHRVADRELEYLKKLVDPEKDIAFDRDNCDYTYAAEDLTKLAGKKYDGKRNHINKFKKLYSFEYAPLTEDLVLECGRIVEDWCAERSSKDDADLSGERFANLELLKNYKTLGCKGALIKVDGKFEAFTVGEMLSDSTAVIHIEKANGSVNGLYTFLNQQFCENEWQNVRYINREQDLGIEGLRKAKLSYHPAMLIDKHIVKI